MPLVELKARSRSLFSHDFIAKPVPVFADHALSLEGARCVVSVKGWVFVMPQVLVIAAGAVSIFCALRWVRREYDRVDSSLRRAERRIRRASPMGTPLVYDAASGFYRPAE